MSNTQTIPTDRHGEVYYGPTTVAEAREARDRIAEARDWDYGTAYEHELAALRESIRAAGFPGVARRI